MGHVARFWKALNKGFKKKNAPSKPFVTTKTFQLPQLP
jgi:hypothetical protein